MLYKIYLVEVLEHHELASEALNVHRQNGWRFMQGFKRGNVKFVDKAYF